MLSVQPGLSGSNDLRVGRKIAKFQMFFSRVGLRTYQHPHIPIFLSLSFIQQPLLPKHCHHLACCYQPSGSELFFPQCFCVYCTKRKPLNGERCAASVKSYLEIPSVVVLTSEFRYAALGSVRYNISLL